MMLGMMLGVIPLNFLLTTFFILLIFSIKNNRTTAIWGFVLFGLLSHFVDAPAHFIGTKLLSSKALFGLWTFLYNLPIFPLTRFNNTMVLGGIVVGLILALPVYFSSKGLIQLYRDKWRAKFEKTKFMKAIKASRFFSLFDKASLE